MQLNPPVTKDETVQVCIETAHDGNGHLQRSAKSIPLPNGFTFVTLHDGKPESAPSATAFVSEDMAAFVVWRWLTRGLPTGQETLASPDKHLLADMAAWGNRK